ncbi:MAG: response regulator [Anaerolineales bacterium]
MSGKILAVDDDPINLKLVAATLGKEGYEIITAGNGKEGYQKAEEILPDLVILDVMMPEMDGYQVCSLLRKNPKTAKMPVMMLTSLSSVEQKIKGFDAGADDYLAKPFAPDELIAHVKALMRRRVSDLESVVEANGKIISVFSLRGGVGVSTLASNLAGGLVSLWNEPVVYVDLVLAAGQSALMFNLPYSRSWGNLARLPIDEIDPLLVNEVLLQHPSGVRILASAPQPEQNEYLTGEKVHHVLKLLSRQFAYIVLDLSHDFQETTLAGLDASHEILLMLSPDLAAVRATVCALNVFENLNYPKEIIRLVENWIFPKGGLPRGDIEKAIEKTIDLQIPFASEQIVKAINVGAPPVISDPQSPLGALFEDFAFLLSKETHKRTKPQSPTQTWIRVVRRFQQRQAKKT